MRYLCPILIGRAAQALNRTFNYFIEADAAPAPLTRVLVDFGPEKNCVGFIASAPQPMADTPEAYTQRTGIIIKPILSVLDRQPIITPELQSLALEMENRYLCPLIAIYQAMLPPSLKPKDSSLNKPKERFQTWIVPTPNCDPSSLNHYEQQLWKRITERPGGLLSTAAIRSSHAYQSLLAQGFITPKTTRFVRVKQDVQAPDGSYSATPDQLACVEYILSSPKPTTLLEGVTGSGKTLVYIELADRMLKQGRGSIILVPEIALTDQTAALFMSRFHNRVSILHSNLTNAAKYDEYLRIREGENRIVVGTRSAIFAPVNNLGLICIDEEHSDTYKQDTTPFYDARMVAQMRAANEGAKVVLGSATPLVEDRLRAEKGLTGFTRLTHKFSQTPLVQATFVDMSQLANLSDRSRILSKELLSALDETLKRKEQAILFINRRGYAPRLQCRKCQRVAECPNCQIPLVLHRDRDRLFCHRCELSVPYSTYTCTRCSSKSFFQLGYGTERVIDDLSNLFPQARIGRMDLDTEPERKRTLKQFRDGQLDIVVGTQMVVKGHDFPRVTLAAALDADMSLAVPSYTSAERTFDLIAQLVGRSGRAAREGRAIIQTYDPTNRTLICASRQDYETFYALEIEDRRRFIYPPYCFMCDILISGEDKKLVSETAYGIKSFLVTKLTGTRCNIYGPSDPYQGIVQGKRFKRVTIKYKETRVLYPVLKALRETFVAPAIQITIDVDSRGD